MSVLNVNIVTERLDGEAFDLVIATNVFIYYAVLEQALAMSNVEAMLKPGAFLLGAHGSSRSWPQSVGRFTAVRRVHGEFQHS